MALKVTVLCLSKWFPFLVWEYFQQKDLTDIGSAVFH